MTFRLRAKTPSLLIPSSTIKYHNWRITTGTVIMKTRKPTHAGKVFKLDNLDVWTAKNAPKSDRKSVASL
jgi:hypothetical protein